MKKIIYNIIVCASFAFVQACSPYYVATQPTNVKFSRPMRPSASHIWIEGDWNWNKQNRMYHQSDGYWTVPYRNRKYNPGRWNTNRKGHYWIKGRWK